MRTAIVPAYNEEASLSNIVERTLEFVDEVVIVDDGSSDSTFEVAQRLAQSYPRRVRVVKLPKNLGKGHAVKIGLRVARGNFVAIQDADGEYPPQQLPNLLTPLEENIADVCFGSRFMGSFTGMSVSHYIANRLLSLLTSLILLRWVSDVMTGAKAGSMKLCNYVELESRGFTIEVELAIKLISRAQSYVEVPFHYHRRKTGVAKIKPSDFFRCILAILKHGLLRKWVIIKPKGLGR